jgi:hypothetical protein
MKPDIVRPNWCFEYVVDGPPWPSTDVLWPRGEACDG